MIAEMQYNDKISFKADPESPPLTYQLPERVNSWSLILNSTDIMGLFLHVKKIGVVVAPQPKQ